MTRPRERRECTPAPLARPRRRGFGTRRLRRRLAAVALVAASPAAAQQISPPDIAELAMRVCIRADPDASEGVRAEGFSVRTRLGRTAVYVHEAGPTMTLTARPAYFTCEIRVPEVEPGYLEELLAELGPAIQRRFGAVEAEPIEDGRFWLTTTESDASVSIEVAEREPGLVSIVSSVDAAPLTPPTQ